MKGEHTVMITIRLDPARGAGTINRNIYGHFSEHLGRCIYDGLFVGKSSPIPNEGGIRSAAVEALKRIGVPVLRWPGGCFADTYHWQDGIGPEKDRPRIVNTTWGGVAEDNSFGTHEFLDLCEKIGCEPYFNVNMGSGTVREMTEWMEYVNSDTDSTLVQRRRANGRKEPWKVKYWCIGNEPWGGGGNMRPEYYADEYRRYQTYCPPYGGTKPCRIACGPNAGDLKWTEVLMERAGKFMDAMTVHYYTVPGTWEKKGSAARFTVEEYYRTLKKALEMERIVTAHDEIMTRFDKEKRVGLIVDEWGAWYDVEEGTNPAFLYQQNTMRDAMIAALTLNIFNAHCDRVVMANLAQMVNVLQSLLLTKGSEVVLTPTYHVFDLYRAHQDARHIACESDAPLIGPGEWTLPQVSASASEKDGIVTVTAANVSAESPAQILLTGVEMKTVTARVLSGAMDAHNDFDSSPLHIEPLAAAVTGGGVSVSLPPCAVAQITLKN